MFYILFTYLIISLFVYVSVYWGLSLSLSFSVRYTQMILIFLIFLLLYTVVPLARQVDAIGHHHHHHHHHQQLSVSTQSAFTVPWVVVVVGQPSLLDRTICRFTIRLFFVSRLCPSSTLKMFFSFFLFSFISCCICFFQGGSGE